MQLTKNQIGFKKMAKNNQKVPFFLFVGFDNIHCDFLDKKRQFEAIRFLRTKCQ